MAEKSPRPPRNRKSKVVYSPDLFPSSGAKKSRNRVPVEPDASMLSNARKGNSSRLDTSKKGNSSRLDTSSPLARQEKTAKPAISDSRSFNHSVLSQLKQKGPSHSTPVPSPATEREEDADKVTRTYALSSSSSSSDDFDQHNSSVMKEIFGSSLEEEQQSVSPSTIRSRKRKRPEEEEEENENKRVVVVNKEKKKPPWADIEPMSDRQMSWTLLTILANQRQMEKELRALSQRGLSTATAGEHRPPPITMPSASLFFKMDTISELALVEDKLKHDAIFKEDVKALLMAHAAPTPEKMVFSNLAFIMTKQLGRLLTYSEEKDGLFLFQHYAGTVTVIKETIAEHFKKLRPSEVVQDAVLNARMGRWFTEQRVNRGKKSTENKTPSL